MKMSLGLQSLPVLFIHNFIGGRIVKQLRCENLPRMDSALARFTDIAVKRDMLLTTQEKSAEVLVFKLNWSDALRCNVSLRGNCEWQVLEQHNISFIRSCDNM